MHQVRRASAASMRMSTHSARSTAPDRPWANAGLPRPQWGQKAQSEEHPPLNRLLPLPPRNSEAHRVYVPVAVADSLGLDGQRVAQLRRDAQCSGVGVRATGSPHECGPG